MANETSCGVLIYRKENNKILYLLLYKKPHLHYKESWDFPRGLMEKNEKSEETALREVREESGITDLILNKNFEEKLRWFYRKDGRLVSKEVIYFLGETKTSDVKISSEHDDFKWCDYEEALKLIKFDNAKQIFKKANEILSGGLNKFF